jgi:hypothetical protein
VAFDVENGESMSWGYGELVTVMRCHTRLEKRREGESMEMELEEREVKHVGGGLEINIWASWNSFGFR